ncbi:hypothetical protein GCM10011594_08180 [Nakamurella endophytica]|uniref:Uncharacterized protein n=1 Tax=Nakamurella endophytica TaxID=1748367 RepID=A0A917SNK5_9ACTN|nr:hypothetical protein GCM10011594_08180 [Nakamurella endophytica]
MFVESDCEALDPCSGRSVEMITVLPAPPPPPPPPLVAPPPADEDELLLLLLDEVPLPELPLAQPVSVRAAAAPTATTRVIGRIRNAPPSQVPADAGRGHRVVLGTSDAPWQRHSVRTAARWSLPGSSGRPHRGRGAGTPGATGVIVGGSLTHGCFEGVTRRYVRWDVPVLPFVSSGSQTLLG